VAGGVHETAITSLVGSLKSGRMITRPRMHGNHDAALWMEHRMYREKGAWIAWSARARLGQPGGLNRASCMS
jgi:hypothetical protein